MIMTLLIIAVALYWMLRETDYLRVRLETTRYQRRQAESVKVKVELVKEDGLKVKTEDIPEETIPYKPSEFTPLEMPETSGKINIVCVRG